MRNDAKNFKVDEEKSKKIKLTEEEAFFGIVMGAVAIDGDVSQEEAMTVSALLKRVKLFNKFNDQQLEKLTKKVQKISEKEGIEAIIHASKEALRPELKESAFAIAVDLVLADGVIDTKEKEFLNNLQRAVGVSDELARKIAEVMVIKNRP